LSALGLDVPGIVAAVSGALGDAGCNLEDSTMTILQGHFAILLVVSAPDGTTAASLESSLRHSVERFDLIVAVRPIAEESGARSNAEDGEDAEALVISLHGADRPGIVHSISAALAEQRGNVVDLSTQLVEGDAGQPVYVLTLRAVVPAGAGERVAGSIRDKAAELGVHCTVREDDPDFL
jgi:glycine cleavage system transcriptional repressor